MRGAGTTSPTARFACTSHGEKAPSPAPFRSMSAAVTACACCASSAPASRRSPTCCSRRTLRWTFATCSWSATAALAEMDIPRIVTLELDGRPIAFHYYLAFSGTMYVHRLAFDPELARLSPGLLTTLEALKVASEEGLGRVEYLGGDERYKLE